MRHKMLRMLKRATMQFYFSAQQVGDILSVIDKSGHVDALVILFGGASPSKNRSRAL